MNFVVVPLLLPLISVIVQLCLYRRLRWQRWFNVISCSLLLLAAISLIMLVSKKQFVVLQVGGWQAPFGITVVADMLSAIMVLLTAIVGLCVAIYSLADIGLRDARVGFYPAYNTLLFGLCGAFLTGDLFNLYVWFEIVLISSFILLVLSGRKFQLEAAVKYAILNLIETLLLQSAIAFIYGVTGTLNMADLSMQIQDSHASGLITVIAVLFIVALAMKGASFPLFFWLPASYHTTSYSSSAFFAGLLSKLGVYSLLRLFTLVFLVKTNYLHLIFAVLACLTLLVGILGAVAHYRPRRVLSYSLISHIGYMLIGLALATPLAMLAAIFYLIQHVIVKSGLFLVAGVAQRYHKAGYDCLYRSQPWLAVLFFIAILSLSGIPPFSGFWPKLLLIQASLQSHQYLLTVIIITVSLLTLYVMTRLWIQYFLSKRDSDDYIQQPTNIAALMTGSASLIVLAVIIGMMPTICYHISEVAAWQLLHPQAYIHAVLGSQAGGGV